MADMVNNAEVINTLTEIKNILSKKDPNQKSDLKPNMEGPSKKEPDIKDLGDQIVSLIEEIVTNTSDIKESQEASKGNSEGKSGLDGIKEAATDAAGSEEGALFGANKNSATPTNKIDIGELKQLDANNGLGFAVLYWKLDEISKKIGGDDGKGAKGKGLGKFFTGLLEGASGIGLIAASLIMFAGAMVIFSFINWLPALIGLGMFALFTTGMIILAKKIGKEQDAFVDFAKGSMLMAGALGIFALSLAITSAVFSGQALNLLFIKLPPINLPYALLGVGVFLAFLAGLALVSKLVAKEQKNFADFAKGSMLLSAALAAFAVSLYITGAIVGSKGVTISGKQILPPFNLGAAVGGVAIFLVFLTAMAGISLLANINGGNFKSFAVASLILCGALAAFAISLYITGAIVGGNGVIVDGKQIVPPFNLGAAIGGTLLFIGFIAAMAGVAILATSILPFFMTFALASLTLAGALGLFAIGIALTALVITGEGGKVGFIEMPKITGGGWAALAGVALFTAFLAAVGALAVAAGLLIIPLGIGAGALALVAGTTILMAKAMMSAAAVINGGTLVDGDGKESETKGLDRNGVDLFFDTFRMFVDKFKDTSDSMGKGLKDAKKAAQLLSPVAKAITKISEALTQAGEATALLEENGGIGNVTALFDGFMSMVRQIDNLGDAKELKQMKKKTKHLAPVANVLADITCTLLQGAQSAKEVKPETIQAIIDMMGANGFMKVVMGLADVCDQMSAKSAVIMTLVADSLVPIVDAIGGLIGIMDEASRFAPGKEDHHKIAEANLSIDQLMNGDGDGKTGFIAIFNEIASGVEYIGPFARKSITQLEPIVNCISALFEVVTKAASLQPGDIHKGLKSISDMAEFIDEVITLLTMMSYKIKPKSIAEIVEFFKGEGAYKDSGGLDAVLSSLGPIAKKVSVASGVDESFVTSMTYLVNGINTISNIDKGALKVFNSLPKSMDKLAKSKISKATNGLKMFAQEYIKLSAAISSIEVDPFTTMNIGILNVSKSLDYVNDGIKHMTKNMKTLKKQASEMADVAKKVNKAAKETAKATAKVAEEDPVYAMLEKWDKEGLLVKSTNKPEKEKASPMQVSFSI